MPNAPKTLRQLKEGTKRPIDHRKSACKRGYGRDWERFRKDYLAMHPVCHDCAEQGRTTIANEVHHIKKVRTHPSLRLDPNNVLGLCKQCHSVRTARGE